MMKLSCSQNTVHPVDRRRTDTFAWFHPKNQFWFTFSLKSWIGDAAADWHCSTFRTKFWPTCWLWQIRPFKWKHNLRCQWEQTQRNVLDSWQVSPRHQCQWFLASWQSIPPLLDKWMISLFAYRMKQEGHNKVITAALLLCVSALVYLMADSVTPRHEVPETLPPLAFICWGLIKCQNKWKSSILN